MDLMLNHGDAILKMTLAQMRYDRLLGQLFQIKTGQSTRQDNNVILLEYGHQPQGWYT